MRITILFLIAIAAASGLHAQQKWELGFGGGYGFAKDARVSNGGSDVSAGLKPGAAFSIFAGNQVRPWLLGEARYSFRISEFALSGNGSEARFDGQAHTLNYDLLFLAGQPSRVQPFVVVGGGVRIYRGTGKESRTQPLNRFAILSKTTDLRALVSVGAGVRIPISRLVSLRFEVRDFITPFPDEVIAPVPGAGSSGWLHDITPMVGIGFRF